MATPVMIWTKDGLGTGYIEDGRTYTDESLTNAVTPGTLVRTENGDVYSKSGDSTPSKMIGNMSAEQFGGLGNGVGGGNSGSSIYDRDAEDYINDIYAAQMAETEAALKNAYDQNVNTLTAERERIPGTYAAAKNQTAANAETQRANFNEYAAASGLNSGAGGQADLAFSSQLQGNLAAINQAQSDALADIDLQLANLKTQYQSDLAGAFAEGNLDKVTSLYENYKTNKEMMISQSKEDLRNADSKFESARQWALDTGARTGDYSGMAAYGWTPNQIGNAERLWHKQYGF
jgi:hypothetical protein